MKRFLDNLCIFIFYLGLAFIFLANKFPFFGEVNLRFINNDFNYYYLNFLFGKQTFGDVIRNLHLPLWNHCDFLGIPYLGNEFGYLYPFNLLTYALGYFFFNESNFLFLVVFNMSLHIALGAFFTFLCLRNITVVSKTAAFLGGIIFGFSAIIISYLGAPPLIQSAIWLPIAFYYYHKTCHQGKIYSIHCAIALAFSLLASYLYVTLAICTVLFIYGLIRFFEDKRNIIDILALVFSVVLGLCLSLIQIFPSYLNRQYSIRQEFSLEQSGNFSITFFNLIDYILPFSMDHESLNYVGIVAIVLVIVSFSFIRYRKLNAFFAFIFIMFTLLGLGLNTYTHNVAYYFMRPLVALFRRPSTLVFVTSFSLAMLSGAAFDSYFREEKLPTRFINSIKRYSILMLAVLAFAILQRNRIMDLGKDPVRIERFLNSLLFTIFILFIFLTISFFINKGKKGNLFQICLVTLVVIDLFTIDNKFSFINLGRSNDQRLMFGDNRIIRFIKSQYKDNPYRIAINAPLIRYLSASRDLYQVGGYAIFVLENFKKIYENSDLLWLRGRKTVEVLKLVGARFTMTEDPLDENDGYKLFKEFEVNEQEGFSFTHIAGNVHFKPNERLYIYTVPDTLPIFYFSNRVILRKEIDFQKMVCNFKKGVDTIGDLGIGNKVVSHNGKIRTADFVEVKHLRNGLAVLDVKNREKGYLFFRDNFMPGWEAYVNNNRTKIYRANHFMKAIFLDQGVNKVVFRYNPKEFKFGALISLFSWIGVLMYLIYRLILNRL